MGIKGSATCVMAFDGAIGWLVGEPNRGLGDVRDDEQRRACTWRCRPGACAERAPQRRGVCARAAAVARARARRQSIAADPIVLHPAMRRTLLRQRVLVEGARLIAYEAAHLIDLAEHAGDAAQRSAQNRRRC